MTLDITALSGGKCCSVYEKERETKYRDQLRFYIDSRVVFERYCYGEAAGLVAQVFGTFEENGTLSWQNLENISVPGNPPPKTLTNCTDDLEILEFDDQFKKYKRQGFLSSDSARGYGKLKLFFMSLKGK